MLRLVCFVPIVIKDRARFSLGVEPLCTANDVLSWMLNYVELYSFMFDGVGAEGSAIPSCFSKWGWVNKAATDLDWRWHHCVNKCCAMMGIS